MPIWKGASQRVFRDNVRTLYKDFRPVRDPHSQSAVDGSRSKLPVSASGTAQKKVMLDPLQRVMKQATSFENWMSARILASWNEDPHIEKRVVYLPRTVLSVRYETTVRSACLKYANLASPIRKRRRQRSAVCPRPLSPSLPR